MGLVLVCGQPEMVREISANHLQAFEVRQRPGFDVGGGSLISCGIACVANVDEASVEWLDGLARRWPLTPLVPVAPWSSEVARCLADHPQLLKDTIWQKDIPDRLASRVAALTAAHFLERTAQRFIAGLGPPLEIGDFLECAWAVTSSPGENVQKVAASAGVNLRNLRRKWRSVPFRASLLEVVQWGVLARALRARDRQNREGLPQNWFAAAYAAGISERTLERLTKKFLGRTPGERIASGFDQAHALLEERFVAWLEEASPQHPTE